MSDFRILPAGDLSLIVEFGNEISTECNNKVMQLNQSIRKDAVAGIIETVPTFRSLLVYYDPMLISYKKLCKYIRSTFSLAGVDASKKKRIIEIPVCYGGEYAPDIKDVAVHTGLSMEEIIALHSGPDYLIYMIGFLPGFPYLGGMDTRLNTPRLSNPRTSIPAGSVGIGGEQTGIYPIASPGGWRLIGRTPVRLYDSERENPTLYQAGDYIRFRSILEEEYRSIEAAGNEYQCKVLMEDI